MVRSILPQGTFPSEPLLEAVGLDVTRGRKGNGQLVADFPGLRLSDNREHDHRTLIPTVLVDKEFVPAEPGCARGRPEPSEDFIGRRPPLDDLGDASFV